MKLPTWLFWLIVLLIPVALLINLGVHPFIDDEGNRSLVALEMLWSGNYITPTLHGSYYYNKPPLWNWILAFSFWLHGQANEWAARLPAVLALMGFSYTIYDYCRRHFSQERAILVALVFLTSGRILFWESLLGLIDISFSWVVFGLIMVIFHEGEKQRWSRLFWQSYLLMCVAFMFKGLPAIVFQGFTLLTYLIWRKEWKRLFSAAHIASGLAAVLLLAAYYWAYAQYNSLENIYQALFVESGKRTAIAYSLGDTLKHVLNFPLELFYHFLPWSLLSIFLLKRANREGLLVNPLVRFCLYAFGVNILVYWLSPNFYPRYILMLLPLLWVVLVAAIPETAKKDDRFSLVVRHLFGLLLLLTVAASLVAPWLKETQFISYRFLKSGVVAAVLIGLLVRYYRQPNQRWFLFIAGALVFRVGFNWFALPPRAVPPSSGEIIRSSAKQFSERWAEETIFLFAETQIEPANSFYVENGLGRIMPRRTITELEAGQLYLFSPSQYDVGLFEAPLIDSVSVRHIGQKYYYLGRLAVTDTAAIRQATFHEPWGF